MTKKSTEVDDQPEAPTPGAELLRIKFRVPGNGAKVTTSQGGKLRNAVCELPVAEARRYCDLDLAHVTDDDLSDGPKPEFYIAPDVEGAPV